MDEFQNYSPGRESRASCGTAIHRGGPCISARRDGTGLLANRSILADQYGDAPADLPRGRGCQRRSPGFVAARTEDHLEYERGLQCGRSGRR